MDKITLLGKTFRTYIPNEAIEGIIDSVADKIYADFKDSEEVPMLLCVLNGSIMFTAGLMKRLSIPLEVASIRMSSYKGTHSTGKVLQTMGLTSSVKGRTVIVCEDIVDTGNTLVALSDLLKAEGAKEVKFCTMLIKPEVYSKNIHIDYIGKEIPNKFIMGYGLDYEQLGRNSKDIYILEQ